MKCLRRSFSSGNKNDGFKCTRQTSHVCWCVCMVSGLIIANLWWIHMLRCSSWWVNERHMCESIWICVCVPPHFPCLCKWWRLDCTCSLRPYIWLTNKECLFKFCWYINYFWLNCPVGHNSHKLDFQVNMVKTIN